MVFCQGDILLSRCFVIRDVLLWRCFVEETFCQGDVLSRRRFVCQVYIPKINEHKIDAKVIYLPKNKLRSLVSSQP
jgi:hypothetical protein